jgi:hypothetical protein
MHQTDRNASVKHKQRTDIKLFRRQISSASAWSVFRAKQTFSRAHGARSTRNVKGTKKESRCRNDICRFRFKRATTNNACDVEQSLPTFFLMFKDIIARSGLS